MNRSLRILLASDEPSVQWKVRIHVLHEDPDSPANRRLRERIRISPRVRALVDGAMTQSYRKWQGRHWVLQILADLGYPPGDESLEPFADSVLRTWLQPHYYREPGSGGTAVPLVNGRYRQCGSKHGGALFALVRLAIGGDGPDRLVERLRHWQWPDGGWNCHLKPTAATSSVYETLLPMRGLAAYGSPLANDAAEVLLTRRILYRRTTGRLIRTEWAITHYPLYWRYDLLGALKGLREAGRLADPRCQDALDLLESKRLPGGGWAAGGSFSRGAHPCARHHDLVDWGETDPHRSNEWVTADALTVLADAGRFPR